jgi:hypothetical protein
MTSLYTVVKAWNNIYYLIWKLTTWHLLTVENWNTCLDKTSYHLLSPVSIYIAWLYIPCETWGFQGSEYEDYCLLKCDIVSSDTVLPTTASVPEQFLCVSNTLFPCSAYSCRRVRQQIPTKYCHVWGVTIDRVWIGEWVYWPFIHDSELHAFTTLSLISTLYK